MVNADLDDLVNDANAARPLTAGGTGGSSQITGWDGLTAQGTAVPSASTIVLDTVTGPWIDISGTTTITAVTLGNGKIRLARATGAFQLTASASLIVNNSTSVNYTTTAGDFLIFTAEGGVVRVSAVGSSPAATTSTAGTVKLATLAQTLAQSPAGLVPTIENLFFPTGHLFGCTISNNSGTPASKLDVAAGTARDSTDSYDLQLTSAITAKDLTSAWAVGSSAGLLDTGAVGNNTYHIYLIKRTDTGVVDVIASLSASAPTLPTNYTLYRRIGSILREGGSIVSFTQVGDKFVRNTPIQDVSATNPGTSAVTRTLSVPTGIKVEAIVTASMRDASAGAAVINVYLSDLSQADVAASATNATVASGGSSSNSNGSATARIMTNTSAQIRSRLDTSGASQTLTIGTHGWVDTRGRI